MADENKNTGPQLGGNTNQARNTESYASDALKSQGDYNNLLKESQGLLKKMVSSYDSIEGRLESLSKSSINVKQINQEILKAKQKDFIVSKKLEETSKNVNANNNAEIQKYFASLQDVANARAEDRDIAEEYIKLAFEQLNVEEQRYITLKDADDLNKNALKYAEEKLDAEKQINKSLGLSGSLLGGIANKLGLGKEFYEDMVETAKEYQKVGAKMSFGEKFGFLTKSAKGAIKETLSDPIGRIGLVIGAYKAVEAGLTAVGNAASKAGGFLKGMSDDSTNIVSDLTGGIASLVKNIPLVGGLLGGLVEGASSMLDLIVGVDDSIVKMGRELNLSADEARQLNRQYQDAAFTSGDIFTTSKKLFEMQVKISDQLGVTNLLSNERLATAIKLQDIADLDAETQKSIVESSLLTGQSSKDTVQSVLAQVQGLKQATGIQFQNQKILKETASLSGYLGLSFAKYPAQLTKSLLTVKAMGLELKEVDALADSFLDFESSISKEFEAQLLTGKDINLTKAREAFLNNDLATAAQEITTQVGSSADFLKLNRIQAESLAGAFGMSRDQLGDMLKKQEVLAVLGAKDTDNAREQLKLGLAKYKNQKALSAALGEDAYNSLVTASTQEKMAAYIEKIKQSIVDFIEKAGFIEKVEEFMKMISDPAKLNGFLGMIRDTISSFIKTAGELLADIIEVGGEIANFFTLGAKGDEREAKAYELAAKVRAGSLGMSAAVASVGGVSLQDPAAKEKVKESQAKQQEDNMSMRPNNNMAPKVYNIIIVDPVTGKSVEKVVSQQVYETVTR